eukprot:366330-Chlamydomonas_euryale.AAC.12
MPPGVRPRLWAGAAMLGTHPRRIYNAVELDRQPPHRAVGAVSAACPCGGRSATPPTVLWVRGDRVRATARGQSSPRLVAGSAPCRSDEPTCRGALT